jgi:hypothetical protein
MGHVRPQTTTRCDLDGKIDRHQRIASRITNQAMIDGIKELMEQVKAQKAARFIQSERSRAASTTPESLPNIRRSPAAMCLLIADASSAAATNKITSGYTGH